MDKNDALCLQFSYWMGCAATILNDSNLELENNFVHIVAVIIVSMTISG